MILGDHRQETEKKSKKMNSPGWIGTSTRVTAQSTHWPVGLGHQHDRGRSTHKRRQGRQSATAAPPNRPHLSNSSAVSS
jgi:hypothetical protein